MAQISQPQRTFSKSGLEKRTIRDAIDFANPIETPILQFLGLNKANGFQFINTPGTTIEWWNDDYRALSGALNMAATVATDAVAFTLSTNGAKVKVGDVLKIGAEKLWVSAIGSDGYTATLTRGVGDTDPITMASNASFSIVTRARLEGADADYGPLEVPSSNYNYTQIFQDGLYMSRNAQKEQQFGIESEWDYQAEKKLPELMRDLEKVLFYGERVARSSTHPGMAGGLKTFITANTASTAATALSIALLQSVFTSCRVNGGTPDTLIVHPWTWLTITKLYDNSNYLRVSRDEDTLGMAIKFVETPWGRLRLLDGLNVPTSDVWMIQSSEIGFYEYDAFFWHELAVTGDSRKAELVGEYSLVVRNPTHHGYIALT